MRLYGGTILVDTLVPPNSPYQIQDLNVPYVVGGRVLWETPLDGLRVGGSAQAFRLNATFVVQDQSAKITLPANLWVGSAEYVAHDLTLAAEYSRWYASDSSNNTMVRPDIPTITSERAYAMATFRASRWFQPGAYYALTFPDVDKRKGRENFQHDVATTLRFDVNAHWLVKLEGHFMSGTAGLDTDPQRQRSAGEASRELGRPPREDDRLLLTPMRAFVAAIALLSR